MENDTSASPSATPSTTARLYPSRMEDAPTQSVWPFANLFMKRWSPVHLTSS